MGGPRTSLAAQSPDVEAELRVRLDGYRKALEGKDLNALRSYYEDFTDSQRAALARYFESAEDLRIEFDDGAWPSSAMMPPCRSRATTASPTVAPASRSTPRCG
jgi:hypothetical protein